MRSGRNQAGMHTTGKPRSSGEPAEATARKIAILIELIRNKRLSVPKVEKKYRLSERQISRDLQELRKIGAQMGFEIGKRNPQGNVELKGFANRPGGLVGGERSLRALIAELFKAFGEPLRGFTDGFEEGATSFVQVVMPRLQEGSRVAHVLDALRAAWDANARVRFIYKGKEREVEPHVAMVRSGRYYLIGRQLGARADEWRIFSLDEIVEPIARCGTFTPKPPPAEYSSKDAIGWIKTGEKHGVEITVSARFAQTAISRRWQTDQHVVMHADGTATLRFSVGDVDEAIRWALGYGDEAWVSAPPSAVERARALVVAIATRY